MERYFKMPESESYDVLIGNGFTIAHKTKDFDYREFTNKVESRLEKKGLDKIRANIFFNTVVNCGEEIKNIEEYILRLKRLKGVAFRVLSEEEEMVIDSLYQAIYQEFELEFTKNVSNVSKKSGINPKIEHIFSTNLLPDFNSLLNQENMPVNFINVEEKSLFKNSHYECKEMKKCLYCYEEASIGCSNKHMCERYFNKKAKILYLHGSSNVWYKEKSDGTYEYSYTSRSNSDVLALKKSDMSPLFIIDGNGESKESRIRKHDYTKVAFEIFKKSDKDLIVYGNSLSDQDSHIVKVIEEKLKQPNFKLYISLYSDLNPEEDKASNYVNEITNVLTKFSVSSREKIYFIKSSEMEPLIFL